LVAGVNGVGKSSFIGVLRSERDDLGFIIDVDKMTLEHGGNVYAAGKDAVAVINGLLAAGAPFTQETTLSGHFIKNVVRRAKNDGYVVRLFYIGLNDCLECKKRIKNRVEKGGHDIGGADVERRFGKRFDDLMEILPYCDHAVFFDNENGFAEVGKYINGKLWVKSDYLPGWFAELKEIMVSATEKKHE
jgi:predicted ABC-type ATPase